ncbi:hypothetical protein AVEN_209922-1 [Araneus ventricosus]|uniref:Uncharacterized protein n=1 Tax=Araneus ventricosus TaxID=182803 RepID=A0A4Y2QXD5_ARAVE|nr:hypothetical protein AVEN_1676-1 [Araneus ventricosus]GBN67914.1 hypothetical protein AVEN_161005-1 [Araneus ventricosus]GBN67919.1 hypothetical protein AVEN_176865-1 [Araneus ventricosus]GBN67925.1 hypothetical protein AVEN_209922-1 [Araneus ventricosus]
METLMEMWSAIEIRRVIQFLRLKEKFIANGGSVRSEYNATKAGVVLVHGETDVRGEQISERPSTFIPMGVTRISTYSPDLEPADFYLFGRSTCDIGISETMPKFNEPFRRCSTTLMLISPAPDSIRWYIDGGNASTTISIKWRMRRKLKYPEMGDSPERLVTGS